jgi:hypothetical protein
MPGRNSWEFGMIEMFRLIKNPLFINSRVKNSEQKKNSNESFSVEKSNNFCLGSVVAIDGAPKASLS